MNTDKTKDGLRRTTWNLFHEDHEKLVEIAKAEHKSTVQVIRMAIKVLYIFWTVTRNPDLEIVIHNKMTKMDEVQHLIF